MAAIAKKPKQTNGLPNPVYVTPALQEQPNELRTNLGDSLVIPTTKAPSITALNSPDYTNMRVAAQNANTAKIGKTAANLTGIPAVIDTYSDAIDKNSSIANNAGAIVAATPAALGNQVSQAVDTRQKLVNQVVAPIAKPISEVADDFGKGLAGVRTANVDATAPTTIPQKKTAITTNPPVTAPQPQVGTQSGIVANAFDTQQASRNAISPKLSTSIAESTNTVVDEEAQPMVGVGLTGRGIVKGVGKNGEAMYSSNGTGVMPSLGVQPQKRLTEEQVRQLYRELPADSFSAAGMGGTTAAQRYETQQQSQNRLNIAQPVDPNAQRNALIAQTKQSGNVGDKTVREAAMAQLQMLDANARAEQDNQYKIATLQQGASQFEQQQQNARELAKGTAEYQSQKDKLEQSNKDREFFDKPYTKEIPVLDPTTGQETGEYKKVTTTVRQEQAEAEKKIVAEGISKAESALKLGLNPKGQPLTDSERQQLVDYISKAKGVK